MAELAAELHERRSPPCRLLSMERERAEFVNDVRWLGRFCLERPFATFYDLQRAINAFDRLQAEPEQGERVLRRLVDRSA